MCRRRTSARERRASKSSAEPAANTPASRRPAAEATWKPAFDGVRSTPGVARAWRTRKPEVARKASETRRTRASPRRAAASARRRPSPKVTIPAATTSQKCAGWCSQWRSRLGAARRSTSPAIGRVRKEIQAAIRLTGRPPAWFPPRELPECEGRSQEAAELSLVVVTAEVVQVVRLQEVLGDVALALHVHGRVDVAVGVRLHGDRDAVRARDVQEVGKRQDVARPVHVDDARQVGLLRPELRGAGQLLEQVRDEPLALHALVRDSQAEVRLGQVAGHHARVVAKAVDGGGRGAHTVLPESRRPLRGVAGEVDRRAGLALPERAQRGDAALRHRADAEPGEVAERRREPGRRDHLVDLDLEGAVPRRAAARHTPTRTRPLDPLERHVERERAAAQARVLVGLQVAHADGGERDHGGLNRTRRAEDYLARPGEKPVRGLEAGVPLADDEDALSLVLLPRPRLGVMRNVLDPRDRRLPGSRDADRKDGGAAAVLAGGRHERQAPVVLPSGRLPAAAVTHTRARPLGEGRETALHLLARGHHERPVHQLWDERAMLVLLGEEAVVVVPLVLARAAVGGRVRLRPREQALVDRRPAEHPSRLVVRREQGVLDPEAGEAVARLEAAGSAPDDDDRIVAGREGLVRHSSRSLRRRVTVWSIL